eukprot:TRINITY_DN2504_c0_g1_i1.p1 TRINITY_DN2504_c0_g1~~TRINITY_DN2504_c0_g1_i1.p1  ORF type:complete len:618 (+),score=210.87 TRINITY_DN2504_c0_g1_i1:73-1926(+)
MSNKRLTTLKQLSRAVGENDMVAKNTWLLPIPEPKFSEFQSPPASDKKKTKKATIFDIVKSPSRKHKSPLQTPNTHSLRSPLTNEQMRKIPSSSPKKQNDNEESKAYLPLLTKPKPKNLKRNAPTPEISYKQPNNPVIEDSVIADDFIINPSPPKGKFNNDLQNVTYIADSIRIDDSIENTSSNLVNNKVSKIKTPTQIDIETQSTDWVLRSLSPVSKMLIDSAAEASNKTAERILNQQILSCGLGISKTTEQALTVRNVQRENNDNFAEDSEDETRDLHSFKTNNDKSLEFFNEYFEKLSDIEKIVTDIIEHSNNDESFEINKVQRLQTIVEWLHSNKALNAFKNCIDEQRDIYDEKIDDLKKKFDEVSINEKEEDLKHAEYVETIETSKDKIFASKNSLEQTQIKLEAENLALKDQIDKLNHEFTEILNVQRDLTKRFNQQKEELLRSQVLNSDETILKQQLKDFEDEIQLLNQKLESRSGDYGYNENIVSNEDDNIQIQTNEEDSKRALKLALDDLSNTKNENQILKEKIENFENLLSISIDEQDESVLSSSELEPNDHENSESFETDFIFNELKKVVIKEKRLSMENKKLKKENAQWKLKIKRQSIGSLDSEN